MEEKIVEEQVYAKLWMLDAEKKLAREKREAQEKKEKVEETLNILSWQNHSKHMVSQQDAEKKAIEQEMLKKQWVIEANQDKEADRQKFILNRERNIELINHNQAERELKQIQINAEKQRDKELLDANLIREKKLIDLEKAEVAQRRMEVLELQDYYKRHKDDKAAFEKAVDEEVAKEADR